MFFTSKRGVNFNVFNAQDLLFAACRGNTGFQPLSPKAFKRVQDKNLQFTHRHAAIQGGRVRDGYLVVTDKGKIRHVGIASHIWGFTRPLTDLSELAATAKGSISLKARFWSDGFLWRRLVKYAFKHQRFTGDFVEGVAEEQSRTDILTNRDGVNAGPTWAAMGEDPRIADDYFDQADYDADVELDLNPETGANRGAVNFGFPPAPPKT
jgi:hypothetical protein